MNLTLYEYLWSFDGPDNQNTRDIENYLSEVPLATGLYSIHNEWGELLRVEVDMEKYTATLTDPHYPKDPKYGGIEQNHQGQYKVVFQ